MTDKNPLVTIVMVTHNEGRYLRESIPAILNQGFSDFEIVLMDNGSQDDTPEYIKTIQDPRVRPFRNENLGLGLAYNIGIENARGQWIALGNADDLWFEHKLAKQVAEFSGNNIGVVFTEAELIDDTGKAIPEEVAAKFPFSFENLPPIRMYEKLFFRTNFLCAPSAIIRKDLLIERPFDAMLIQLQDFDMWSHLIKSVEFKILPEKLTGYRVRLDGSNISLNTKNRSRVLLELAVVYERFFENATIDFFKAAFGSHLRNPDFTDEISFEFEKAFLYLKLQEPAIRQIGLQLLYQLMSQTESREHAFKQYGLTMLDVWQWALTPIFADANVLDESAKNHIEISQHLKEVKKELTETKELMRRITSGKLWKLRESVYSLLRPR
ncbi:MAG: glycosyltransferase [Candidatus Obscuribacterales bacterium]|nr:glycosyltransferase [Candidatus Obscuribacterales bacterium]